MRLTYHYIVFFVTKHVLVAMFSFVLVLAQPSLTTQDCELRKLKVIPKTQNYISGMKSGVPTAVALTAVHVSLCKNNFLQVSQRQKLVKIVTRGP